MHALKPFKLFKARNSSKPSKPRKPHNLFKWGNLKIGLKYGIALTVTIVLLVIASGFVTMSLFQIKDAVSAIEVTANRSIDLTYMTALFKTKELIILDYSSKPRESLIEEYAKVEKNFNDMLLQIEPKMDTEDLKFFFWQVKKNNSEMDDVFKNDIIANLQKNNREAAAAAIAKVSGLRNPTALLLEKMKEDVDKERELKMLSAYKEIEDSILMLLISIISAMILGSMFVFFISRGISRNLNNVVKIANNISEGELNVDPLKYIGRDEIGRLSESINKMQHKLREIIQEITASSYKVDEESNNLLRIASEVQQGSQQIASTMQEMSSGAEEQAGSASEIAGSISKLAELVDKAALNKEALQRSSSDILVVVGEGSTQMETSIGTMNQINVILQESVTDVKQLDENSQKVTVLVQIINNIAQQTNLLALNAAIEAARAGEAGRGFAVVADEIRKLAEQVGSSVKQITDIVVGIQVDSKSVADSLEKGYQKVQEGTYNIKTTGEIFVKINEEISTMAERIKNVAESLDEISQNSNTINIAGEHIAAISEENSAGIEETVASVEQQNSAMEIITEKSNSLANASDQLKKLISQFKI
ncbi:MAG: hypothetical protein K0R84_676 [Clostridia bacterium]|jgi:methyl-accepting chemotaxis protein|nr:hypothetical protein [Clostridia bacterium]